MQSESPKVNILLVDDEPKNLTALEAVLGSDDRNLVPAGSGPEALKRLLDEDFAVILLDVHMPGMDGFETAALIRGRDKSRNTPIIFLTAANQSETHVARGYSLGAVDYIFKPVEPEILQSKVAVFVELFKKTEQVKRQAKELAETTTFLKSVLEASTAYSIIAQDLEGTILAWNEGAYRLYGYTAEEMVGTKGTRQLHLKEDVEAGKLEAALKAALKTGKHEDELESVRKNGQTFTASRAITLRRDAAGKPLGYVLISKDITEQKLLAREQAARAEAEAGQRRLDFLARASALLAGSLDYETTLQSVARMAVPYLADWCVVDIVEEDQSVRRLALAYADPGKESLAREVERDFPIDPSSPHGSPKVLSTGEPEIIAKYTDATLKAMTRDGSHLKLLRQLGFRSSVCLPLQARDRTLGAITFGTAESGRHYGPEDLAMAEALARRAALAVDNSRLYREAQEALASRDKALAEAEAERDRLQQVLDVMPEGIAIADASGQVIMANAVANEIGGPLLPFARPLYEISSVLRLDGTPYELEQMPLQRSVLFGEVVRGEQMIIRNGVRDEEVPVLVNSAPIRSTTGTIMGAVVVFQDITAIKDLERTRDEFLSSASHDLKTPLTTIRGLAQLAQRQVSRIDSPEAERVAERLAAIVEATSRMTNLINELLDVARIQMGRPLDLSRRPTDLVALARRVVEAHQPTTDRHRLFVQSKIPELVGVWDDARLERVLGNLVSNSIKYSPNGGEVVVTIGAAQDGNEPCAVISVRDQGLGIPAADLPHIFDRFHRAGNVTGRIAGTGIGLASVRQIVEQHGGTISAESIEGAGTTLTVQLPLAPVDLDLSVIAGER
ncbi:MAG: PAS domain S-box protein [Chloroflexi bacterium]|nr:PAS domain S-box protein [Chloroflexota bacterium]